MRLSQLVLRNVRRLPLRTIMTILTVPIMLSAFIFPRSLVGAQEEQIRQSPNDRVVTRSKLGWGGSMPLAYADKIRENPGVRQACASRWAGFQVPGKDNLFFHSFGIEDQPFIAMHHELEAAEDQKAAYLADDHGAWVSQELARQLGWQVGDHVVLESRQYPGKWELNTSGIYTPKRDGFAQRSIWIHYAYSTEACLSTSRTRSE